MMTLTRDNYYSREADLAYMSCSQYQSFCECEAKALAKLQGRWTEEPSEAFIVGNYFHTFFEGESEHRRFVAENRANIFKKQTKKAIEEGLSPEKYAPFQRADEMIQVAKSDPLISSLIALPGENEQIMTGELFGVPWRIRVDKYVPEGRMIIDWKTCASINELKYAPSYGERVTFVEYYGYMMRAAVYSEIEMQYSKSNTDPHFIIVAISKEEHPDKEVLRLNHRAVYDYELEKIKQNIGRIQWIKEGRIRPKRCGTCDYCRATKRLDAIKPYYTLKPQFREEREDDLSASTLLDLIPEAPGLEHLSAVRQTDSVDVR